METEKIEDRRTRKTKRALEEGLAELLSQKELNKITIKELTEKADVHRGTFYAHYEDVYDLYHQIEERVIDEISDILSKDYAEGFKGLKFFYDVLFAYILDNKQICRFLFRSNANHSFFNSLSELFLESCLESWAEEYEIDATHKEYENYARFYLAGAFAIVSRWAEANFAYSAEELVLMFSDIDISFGNLFKSKSKSVKQRLR